MSRIEINTNYRDTIVCVTRSCNYENDLNQWRIQGEEVIGTTNETKQHFSQEYLRHWPRRKRDCPVHDLNMIKSVHTSCAEILAVGEVNSTRDDSNGVFYFYLLINII